MNPEVLRDLFFEAAPRYWCLEVLGRGGMSVVYKARDLELDDVVALKVFDCAFPIEEDALLRLARREVRLNRKIKHPNVAQLHDFGKAGTHFYLSMEFVPGRDLARVVDREGPLPVPRALAILRQIALGAEAAHEQGVVHRDLKSPNVMVDHRDAVAILDFGLAMRQFESPETPEGYALGTPLYMSPEQAIGNTVDARSDLYSIGVIAYELLTGTLPFVGRSALETMSQHVSEPVPPRLERRADLPADLRAIVLRCLEKKPSRRFQTAGELAHAFAQEATREAHPAAAAVPAPAGRGAPGRVPVVLVVDDDEEFLRAARPALGAAGLEVLACTGGPQAIEILRAGGVDLLLLDVWMPMVDGFDVVRALRAEKPDHALPIFLVTAATDRSQIAYAMSLGVSDILEKGAGLEAIAARLRMALSEAAA